MKNVLEWCDAMVEYYVNNANLLKNLNADNEIVKEAEKKIGFAVNAKASLLKAQARPVKKIHASNGLLSGNCPRCSKRVSNIAGGNYCDYCGQRIKWVNQNG